MYVKSGVVTVYIRTHRNPIPRVNHRMANLNSTHHVGIISLPPIITVDSSQEYVILNAVSSLKCGTIRIQVSGLRRLCGKRRRDGSRIRLRLRFGFESLVFVDQYHILVYVTRNGQSGKG